MISTKFSDFKLVLRAPYPVDDAMTLTGAENDTQTLLSAQPRSRGEIAPLDDICTDFADVLHFRRLELAVAMVVTWAAGAGVGVLTFNSALAIHRAKGDPAAVAFVAGSYAALLALLGVLRAYERAPPGSPARERAKRAVWPLTTLLTAGFAWKVAALMPSQVAGAAVWGLAVATSVAGFFALYVNG
ncbi:hypothetical protein ACP70R_041866 [Stipagrostis hirtigluma subsp. patula]